jgi:hypothetical protein
MKPFNALTRHSTTLALALALAFALLFNTASVQASCDRKAREVDYFGDPVTVYVSAQQWSEVVFPELIVGDLAENREELELRRPQTFLDRIYLQSSSETYVGSVFVHGQSGTTYHLRVLARTGCADSTIKLVTYDEEAANALRVAAGEPSESTTRQFKLTEMLQRNEVPRGFHRNVIEGSERERLIYRQGPVDLFIKEIWEGRQTTGMIIHAVNNGRTPYRVAIENIDYANPKIKAVFGEVREVSMLPIDMRLGPKPEYAADLYQTTNQGLIFIVSKRERRTHVSR